MVKFEIIEAKPFHCGQMSRLLRKEHHNALVRLDVNVHKEMRAMFDASSFRKAWLIDSELAAVGGVAGSALESSGYVWVALSEKARKYPIQIVKEARRQLAIIMQTKRELISTVIPADEAATRLAVFLGFHVDHNGRGQTALSKFSRRDLKRYIEEDPELRIPAGNGYFVAIGYHDDARV